MVKKVTTGIQGKNRQYRYFSESFKRQKVKEIERNLVRVSEICKEYEVSHTTVYNWIYKYSGHRKRGVRQVIEPMSDTRKLKEMKKEIAELQRLIGQKQVQLEFQDNLIEMAEQMYGVDIKKKLGSQLSIGSGSTEENTNEP